MPCQYSLQHEDCLHSEYSSNSDSNRRMEKQQIFQSSSFAPCTPKY